MQWLMPIVGWGSKQPPVIRWPAAFALFGIALAARYWLGMFYGGLPSLAFYPVILIVAAIFGWKEALAVLMLSVTARLYLFLPPGMYLQPVGWLLVGTLTIAIIVTLKEQARNLATANEGQRILLQELQHRVANTLQSVIGRLEADRRRLGSDPIEANKILEEAVRRISASADLHRRLSDPTLFQGGLRTIVSDAAATVIDSHST